MPADAAFRRRKALATLAEERLRDGFLGRAASIYGWGVAISYAALVLIAPESARTLLARALATACGVVGTLVAAALLRDLGAARERDTLFAVARENGFTPHDLRLVRGLAAARRFGKAVGLPFVVLVLVSLAARAGGAAP